MKVKFTIVMDIEDDVPDTEFRQSIEDKRRYLEDDVRVRFHNPDLFVDVMLVETIS